MAAEMNTLELVLRTASGELTIDAPANAVLGAVLAEELGPGSYKAFQGGVLLPLDLSMSALGLDDGCRLDILKNNPPLTDDSIRDAVRKYCGSPESRAEVVAEYGEIGEWDTSAVTSLQECFKDQESFNEDISAWETGRVTSMEDCFSEAKAFNHPIGSWDTSSVVNMSGCFNGASSFNQPVESWDTSRVTNMSHCFCWATTFNQPVESWDTSSVSNMYFMFGGAHAFNQSIEQWCTANVTKTTSFFEAAQGPKQHPSWLEDDY